MARQFSTEMDGLPLALDQAGAFIEETPSTLTEYLALYRAEGAALRARRGRAPSHPSVTITFSLAFARVAEANPAAADLVRGCAFLAPDAIPEEIFTQGGRESGKPIAKLVIFQQPFKSRLHQCSLLSWWRSPGNRSAEIELT